MFPVVTRKVHINGKVEAIRQDQGLYSGYALSPDLLPALDGHAIGAYPYLDSSIPQKKVKEVDVYGVHTG